MITNSVIAPIHLNALSVSNVSFSVIDDSADDMELQLEINYETQEPANNGSDGTYALRAKLDLTASLAAHGSPEDAKLKSSITVLAEVSMASSYFQSDEEARNHLATNALSMSYSHARSTLMTIAGMTPAKGFMLPPIIPSAIKPQKQ